MPRAKQPGTVEAQQDDVAGQAQVNGTKPESAPESAEGKAGAAKRVAVKATKGTGETSKEDVTTKAQHPKQHAKPEPAQKAPEASDGLNKAGAQGDEPRDLFLEHQRTLLAAERNNYTRQAEELKAQADALALEHEPGDVQFDEEGGEGVPPTSTGSWTCTFRPRRRRPSKRSMQLWPRSAKAPTDSARVAATLYRGAARSAPACEALRNL